MKINEIQVKSIMTKSSLPLGGYSVNPYVGCPFECKYCYASFMKRFTGHKEPWGKFLDVKYWPEIKNPEKYSGKQVLIGSVTDGYNPYEKKYKRTRKLLEEYGDYYGTFTLSVSSGNDSGSCTIHYHADLTATDGFVDDATDQFID